MGPWPLAFMRTLCVLVAQTRLLGVGLSRGHTLPHPAVPLQAQVCYESFTLMGCLHFISGDLNWKKPTKIIIAD